MRTLPQGMAAVLEHFSRLFTKPTWRHMQILLIGAVLCQGARHISTVLRVMGLSQEKRFEKYHRVLNRAKNHFNDSMFDGDYVKIKRKQWEALLDQLSRTG